MHRSPFALRHSRLGQNVAIEPPGHAVVVVAGDDFVGDGDQLRDGVGDGAAMVGDLEQRNVVEVVTKGDDRVGTQLLLQATGSGRFGRLPEVTLSHHWVGR